MWYQEIRWWFTHICFSFSLFLFFNCISVFYILFFYYLLLCFHFFSLFGCNWLFVIKQGKKKKSQKRDNGTTAKIDGRVYSLKQLQRKYNLMHIYFLPIILFDFRVGKIYIYTAYEKESFFLIIKSWLLYLSMHLEDILSPNMVLLPYFFCCMVTTTFHRIVL